MEKNKLERRKNTEYTISIAKTNLIAFALILPIGIVQFVPMILLHELSFSAFAELTLSTATFSFLKLIVAITIGVFIHELLHGLGWAIFAKKRWKSISFGIKWEYLTPYCHCNEALRRNQFLVGAILPLLILGLLPVFISFFTGSFKLWLYGFFFTVAAGGDIIAIWMLRKVSREQMVQDHPSEMGFVVLGN